MYMLLQLHALKLLSSIHIDPLESLVVQVASSSPRWLPRTSRAPPRSPHEKAGRRCWCREFMLPIPQVLKGLRTCTHNACLLSYSAVVFGIGLQLTSVRLVIWFHLQNVECTSHHSPSSFPKFLVGCLRKPVSRYPAVATVQEAQIVQGNQVPKSCPVCWWRSSLSDAAVWIALCRSVVFQVIGIGSSTSSESEAVCHCIAMTWPTASIWQSNHWYTSWRH